MIDEILPAAVVAAETFVDRSGIDLFPEEEVAVERAVEKRKKEFASARDCARRALERLGRSSRPIPVGGHGEPLWPAGIVGSITHCDGYRACALAEASDVATIGIDAELHMPLPSGIVRSIASAEEVRLLRDLERYSPTAHWDRLLFSAKESVYKAWFPLARRWLGFEDAIVNIDPCEHTFCARLLVDGPILGGQSLRGLSGRWLVRDQLVVTAIAPPRTRRKGDAVQ